MSGKVCMCVCGWSSSFTSIVHVFYHHKCFLFLIPSQVFFSMLEIYNEQVTEGKPNTVTFSSILLFILAFLCIIHLYRLTLFCLGG